MQVLGEFKKFALRGNVVDLAVGFTVGAGFTTVVKSLVSDIIMPPVGLAIGQTDFADLFVVLQNGPKIPPPYLTLEAAHEAGAVTLNYGLFINSTIAFSLVALAMFLVVHSINRIDEALEAQFGQEDAPPAPGEPTEKKCAFCLSTIPIKASRCPACTSHLQPVSLPSNKPAAPQPHN